MACSSAYCLNASLRTKSYSSMSYLQHQSSAFGLGGNAARLKRKHGNMDATERWTWLCTQCCTPEETEAGHVKRTPHRRVSNCHSSLNRQALRAGLTHRCVSYSSWSVLGEREAGSKCAFLQARGRRYQVTHASCVSSTLPWQRCMHFGSNEMACRFESYPGASLLVGQQKD